MNNMVGFSVGKFYIPGFAFQKGIPTKIDVPGHGNTLFYREVISQIDKSFNGEHVIEFASQVIRPRHFLSIYQETVKSFLLRNPIQICPEFIAGHFRNLMTDKVKYLGGTERFLLDLATKAGEDSIVVFTTSGCDPQGLEVAMNYIDLIKEKLWLLEIGFMTNMPNQGTEWQVIKAWSLASSS